MTARKVDLLLPLLVVVLASGAVALVVGLTGTSATEPGPPTPFEQGSSGAATHFKQDIPKDPQTNIFPNVQPDAPLSKMPPMESLFGPAEDRPPQKSVEEMTPEELETHNKIEALKKRRTPFNMTEPIEEEEDN